MLYVFDDCQLDTGKLELRRNGEEVSLEPQVFALLSLLVENRERLLTKDELIEKIWDGRIVSEAAVSSCIKSARRAVGDDGTSQRIIRTVHGRGFRCIADVKPTASMPVAPAPADDDPDTVAERARDGKPSIAVLPFRLLGCADAFAAIADAVPHELITALSRLRWLFVIARGSTFRFRSVDPDVAEVGKALRVRYCLSGIVEVFGTAITISVELSDTRSGGVIWAERFSSRIDDVHDIRAEIVANIVSALEMHIPANEARRAQLAVPENLDAWSAYHLGLQHMYRFNKKDNEVAEALFSRAVANEPGFARAHAGLSFTHFQNAFLRQTDDTARQIDRARACAERSVELDPLDPFANFTMGRSFWLSSDLDGSLAWLDRAVSLSPNFAQGLYARAWTDTISGRGQDGRALADAAMALSPLDPLLYAMQSTRALSFVVDGHYERAVDWADRGARAPGAHFLIAMIAVVVHALAGDREKAGAWARQVKSRRPDATSAHFFRAFPFEDERLRRDIAAALARQGIR